MEKDFNKLIKDEDFENLMIEFDEMTFYPATTVPDPETYAKDFKERLIKCFTKNDVYLDVIKFLINNSKRFNEKNLWVNVIDALVCVIYDVEFCKGCKHFKDSTEADCFCDMVGEGICVESLIERAKQGLLK